MTQTSNLTKSGYEQTSLPSAWKLQAKERFHAELPAAVNIYILPKKDLKKFPKKKEELILING